MKRRNNGRKLSKAVSVVLLTMTLLGLPLLSIGCAAFGKNIVLHPITTQDIMPMKAGDNFTAPKNGMFLSDMYVQEVMEVKVK